MITEVILFHAGLASPSVLHGSARNSKSGADPNATLMSSASMADGGGGKLAVDRKAENTGPEGTRGCTRLEMWEKTAMKTDDLNHPQALQRKKYD